MSLSPTAVRYHVTVTRENGAWLAEVAGLEGGHTWARNVPALLHSVAEVIVLAENFPDGLTSTVVQLLDVEFRTGNAQLDAATADLRRRREDADKVAADTARIAAELTAQGWSVRDVGAVLGVSPQRVSQLTATN